MILIQVSPGPDGMALLQSAYDEAAVAQMKAIPGCTWDAEKRLWTAPAEVVPALTNTLQKAGIAKVRGSVELPEPDTAPLPQDDRLYQHQREGVRFITTRVQLFGGALLADEVGVGKGPQALVAIQELCKGRKSRVLIICPAVVVEHWREEIKRWVEQDAARITAKKPDWEGYGVISYDSMRSLLAEKKKDSKRVKVEPTRLPYADVVVLDEVHFLAKQRSQRSKAISKYLDHYDPEAIIGLSGTPMLTNPIDLWHPLHIIFPHRFGNMFKFAERYCNGRYDEIPVLDPETGENRTVWKADGATNLDELKTRLKPLSIRRVRSEVIDLPAHQRITIPVELPARQRSNLSRLMSDVIDSGNDVQRLLANVEEHKVKAAVELAQDLLSQGHRPLILTTRRDTADIIGEKLKAPVAHGATPPGMRRKILLTGKAGVSTIYAITTGINLTEFNAMIFCGLDWQPSTLLQVEARPLRIGQTRSVLYYYLIGMGSIDEVIRSTVINRLDHFSKIMHAPEEQQLATDLGKRSAADLLKEIAAQVRSKYT